MIPLNSCKELHPQLSHRLEPVVALALKVRIVPAKELVGEPEDLGLLLPGYTEDGREDAKRMRGGDLGRQTRTRLHPRICRLDQTVHQIARAFLDHRAGAFDGSRREPGDRDLAVFAMLGRIHPDDHAHLADPLVVLEHDLLLFALQYDAEPVQEEVGLLGDLADVLVAHDRIEGVEAGGLAEVQSIQSA